MFWPLMNSDRQSRKVENKLPLWLGIMFLTNVFFIPFMALRAAPEPSTADSSAGVTSLATAGGARGTAATVRSSKATTTSSISRSSSTSTSSTPTGVPDWGFNFGIAGAAVGAFSIAWAFMGRPEFGDLAARAAYLQQEAASNRVFYAFIVDSFLYYVWQLVLMENVPAGYKYVPFFGMAAWLVSPQSKADDSAGTEV